MTTSLVRRLRWHAYRTPLAHIVKQGKQLAAGGEIARRKALMAELPFDERIEAAVAAFQRDGFARLDDLADRRGLEQLQAAADAGRDTGDAAAAGKFGAHKGALWSHAIDAAMVDGRLDATSAFARAAMQPTIVSVVAHALGLVPRLDYVTVTDSKPMINEPSHSQLWHRDYDDTRVIKAFVYLSDVTSIEDGPFTFLPGPVSDSVGFSLKSHRPDTDFAGRVDLERQMVRVTGPRFSCFMVETSRCLHMGSRVAHGHSRLMYTATYFAPPRIYPEPAKPFFLPSGNESAVERALLLPGA